MYPRFGWVGIHTGARIMRRKREKEVSEIGIGQYSLVLLFFAVVLFKLTFTVSRLSSQKT